MYYLKHTYTQLQTYTFLLTQVESQYFLLSIHFTVTTQISTPSHSDTHTHTSCLCLLRYWPLSDIWEVSGLTIFSLWAAVCRGLLGQHTTVHPYQQIGNTCRTASVRKLWWVCVYVYTLKCVFLCTSTSRTNSEREILECVWAGVYQRIIRREFLMPACSLFCYKAKTSHKSILTIKKNWQGIKVNFSFFSGYIIK